MRKSILNGLERMQSVRRSSVELSERRRAFAYVYKLMCHEGPLTNEEEAFLTRYRAEHPDKVEIINDYMRLCEELGESVSKEQGKALDFDY